MASSASSSVPLFKVAIMGDTGAGKTSICQRLTSDTHSSDSNPTIGAAYIIYQFNLPNFGPIRLDIWDTAGQCRFHSLAPMYYRDCNGVFIVYDITRSDSFRCAKNWVDELHRELPRETVIVLVGNKRDRERTRAVPTEEAAAYAQAQGLAAFFETSAKTGDNVKEIFVDMGTRLSSTIVASDNDESSMIDLLQAREPGKKGCKCEN